MSMFSAVAAEHHNEILAKKAKELEAALNNRDWEAVAVIYQWMANGPFSE